MDRTFFANLPATLVVDEGPVERRLLQEYGSVFIARNGVTPPDRIVFRDDLDVSTFQDSLEISQKTIGGLPMTLQSAAMEGLLAAEDEAAVAGLSITPRGPDSAARTYADTVALWASRVEPALEHWQREGKLSQAKAESILGRSPFEQVELVLTLEDQGIYFSKDLSKSILYSVAPPGTSQHLSLLAFDAVEFNEPEVRDILASHLWFQTVISDLPHFTYLGVRESELADLGLKQVQSNDRTFWIPDI
jgi:hypothetical protein